MEKDFKEDMEGDSKLHNATRCAKAAMLLLSLRNRHHQQVSSSFFLSLSNSVSETINLAK